MNQFILYSFLALLLALQIHAIPVQQPRLDLAVRDASSASLMDPQAELLKPAVPASKRGILQAVKKVMGKKETKTKPAEPAGTPLADRINPRPQRFPAVPVLRPDPPSPRVSTARLPAAGAADVAPAHPPGLAGPSNPTTN